MHEFSEKSRSVDLINVSDKVTGENRVKLGKHFADVFSIKSPVFLCLRLKNSIHKMAESACNFSEL